MDDQQDITADDQEKPAAPQKGNRRNIAAGCVVGGLIIPLLFVVLIGHSLGMEHGGSNEALYLLIIPGLLTAFSIDAIFRQKRKGFAQGLLIAIGIAALLFGICVVSIR